MMTSKLMKNMKGVTKNHTTAHGLLYNDLEALSPYQRECNRRLSATIQLEEEAYLDNHPEVVAMLKVFLCKILTAKKRDNVLAQAGHHFTRPIEELDEEVRQILKLSPEGPYLTKEYRDCEVEAMNLKTDLQNIMLKHYPPPVIPLSSSESETPITASSSFLSVGSSATTVPTPEPVPPPEPTLPEIMMQIIVNAMDRATMSKLTEKIIKYDTAYVEVMKIIEAAMEIPVIEIRIDIADLIAEVYAHFDEYLDERARIVAQITWERRMRKKLKKTLRRQKNFMGHETPPVVTSEIPSSHESYRKPPQRPCICYPQTTYNRYPKDRFGVYVPTGKNFEWTSITATPTISALNMVAETGKK